jgi:peptidoglycan/xylan/chitin deacetylase (PgdA/CDA1 family)
MIAISEMTIWKRDGYSRIGACLVVLAACLIGGQTDAAQPRIRIVFRYDDYSNTSATEVERELLEIFSSARARHVFAVIPKRDGWIGGEKAELLRKYVQEGSLEIALHGYEHIKNPHGHEFTTLSYSRQLEMITEGKSRLEAATGAPVVTFVPPWNGYDRQTVSALSGAGIRILSADYSLPAADGVAYAPMTATLATLRLGLEAARVWRDDSSPIIVVNYHPYDFRESGDPRGHMMLSDFGALVRGLVAEPDVELVTFSDLLTRGEDLSPQRLWENMLYHGTGGLHPLQTNKSCHVYFGRPFLSDRLAIGRLQLWALYAGGAAFASLAGALGSVVLAPWPLVRRWLLALVAVVVVASALYGVYDYRMFTTWKGLTGLAVTAGGLLGAVVGLAIRPGRIHDRAGPSSTREHVP